MLDGNDCWFAGKLHNQLSDSGQEGGGGTCQTRLASQFSFRGGRCQAEPGYCGKIKGMTKMCKHMGADP